CLWSRRS
ncbi:hypothetical protein KIPB_007312, partial [Kipferlia bialata]